MKKLNIKAVIAVAVAAAALVTNAKTVAWYRFEEAKPSTATTGETVFENTADPGKFPAYARVSSVTKNNQYTPDNYKTVLTTDPNYMPAYAAGFPEGIAVTVPDIDRRLPNASALNMRNGETTKDNPASGIFIDDCEELRLQTFTIEFFMRMPTASSWRTILSRNADKLENERVAYIMRAQTSESKVYISPTIRAVENPLRDASGLVTNTISYKINGSGAPTLADDRWHHLAIVVDGVNKTFKYYVDHVQYGGYAAFKGNLHYEPGYPITFGLELQSHYASWQGSIDEIRISDEALAPSQMLGYAHVTTVADAVDEKTLLYYPFAGSLEPQTLGADDMAKAITYTPFLENKALGGKYAQLDLEKWNYNKATNPAPLASSLDVLAASRRFGLTAENSIDNLSSVHAQTNNAANDWAECVMVPVSFTLDELFADDCTIEFDCRLPYAKEATDGQFECLTGNMTHILGWNNNVEIIVPKKGQWNSSRFQVKLGGTNLKRVSDGTSDTTVNSYRDGKWHHLVIVWTKSTGTADFYVDKRYELTASGLTMPKTMSNSYPKGLVVGGSYWGGRFPGEFDYDEVRISRGALRPYQFMASVARESDDLAYATFDGDYLISPYADFFAAATANGASFTVEKPASIILDGKDGQPVRAKNTRSVSLSDGSVTWPGHDIVTDSTKMTAEFFVKTSVADAPLLAVGDLWSLDSSLNLTVGEATVQPMAGACIADGQWHHVAVVFDGADAKAYVDYELVVANTFAAALPTAQEADLVLGGDGFTGKIDELRFSPKVLAADEFLHAFRKGMMILLR